MTNPSDKYRWNIEQGIWEFHEPSWGGWCVLRRGPHVSNLPMTYAEGIAYLREKGIEWPGSTKPAATDYACPECHADSVLADRGDKVGICAECGWFGPLQEVDVADEITAEATDLHGFSNGAGASNG